ncbi:hypothetical protein PMI14_04579 [Acidovorax sp. CF316]|uniref:hypothetical protein n=1 Tax=Acidovorax sp. CF316 TaxID=1144317 RepID=UPI00026BC7A9|nr:hypothetical protein [Acidovorax sp. CF316]EJE50795.1 hypothetical protein PMI14_04579 [Acidovorax sp. CF316]
MRVSRMTSAGVVLCTAALLGGCATWSTSSVHHAAPATEATASAPRLSPSQVSITDKDIVDRRYAALGDITVRVNKTTIFHPAPTPELVNDRLREKAAAMWADAVVLVRYGDVGISMMSWGTLEGKGRAVKFVP